MDSVVVVVVCLSLLFHSRVLFFSPRPFPSSKTPFIIKDVTRADPELNFSLLSLVKLLESFTFFFQVVFFFK